MQVIPYDVLRDSLELVSARQLEDLLIEAVHAGVIHGKLDQSKQCLEVDSCISRDVPPHATTSVACTLTQWCSDCETVLTVIKQQVERVNTFKEAYISALQQTEAEVRNICQKILASSSHTQSIAGPSHLAEYRQNTTLN